MAKIATAVKKAVSAMEEALENLKKKLGLVKDEDAEETEEEEESEDEDEEEDEDEDGEEEEETEEEEEDEEDEDEDSEDEDEEEEEEDEDEEEEKPKGKKKAAKDEDEEDEAEEESEDEDDEDEDDEEGEDEEEEEGSDESDPTTVATEYVNGLIKKGDVEVNKATIGKMFKLRMSEEALEGVDKKWTTYKQARILLKKGKAKEAFIEFTKMCVDDDGELHGWDEPYLKTAEGGKAPTPFCSGLPMIVEKTDAGYIATDRASSKKYSIKVEKDEDGEISMEAAPYKSKVKAGKAKVKAEEEEEEEEEEAPAKKAKKPVAKKGKIKVKKGKK